MLWSTYEMIINICNDLYNMLGKIFSFILVFFMIHN